MGLNDALPAPKHAKRSAGPPPMAELPGTVATTGDGSSALVTYNGGGSLRSGPRDAALDALAQERVGAGVHLHMHPQAMVQKVLPAEALEKPSAEDEDATAAATAAALSTIVDAKTARAKPTAIPGARAPSQYIKYTPSEQQTAVNPKGARQRVIRMVDEQIDPLQPARFQRKKVPRGPPSPPPTVMHSPPRKLSAKDHEEWKIPPAVSRWKNNKGFTIALDKRLAAEGKGLEDTTVNDNFAKLAESLYIAERVARENLEARNKVQEELAVRERDAADRRMAERARQARVARTGGVGGGDGGDEASESSSMATSTSSAPGGGSAPKPIENVFVSGGIEAESTAGAAAQSNLEANETEEERAGRLEREKLKDERRRERERDRAAVARGKRARLDDRDVSERVALGRAGGAAGGGDVLYDARLFNRSQGIGSNMNDLESYQVYDKPMFNDDKSQYKPKAGAGALGGAAPVAFEKKNTDGAGAEKKEGAFDGVVDDFLSSV